MSTDDGGWTHVVAGADAGVQAWGASQAAAFAQAALGVFALIVKPEDVVEREHREVRAQGETPEQLLLNWINECLYVHEIEGFVVRRVEIDTCTGELVHGVLHGEEMAPQRHRVGMTVRAATTRGLLVVEREARHEARINLDV